MNFIIYLRHEGWNPETAHAYAMELKSNGFSVVSIKLGFPNSSERDKILSMIDSNRKEDILGVLDGWRGVIRLFVHGHGTPPLPVPSLMGFSMRLKGK
jgi:hypothetical protein